MNVYRLITLGLTYLVATSALAQWQWTDKDGRKVFSDRPPPSEILDKDILKRPGRSATVQAPSAPTASSAIPIAKKANEAPKLSGVDKELMEKKQLAEDAEVAKKKAEEEKVLKARLENCSRAKQAKATFDSGVRVAHTNQNGEREIMDEATRALEVKRIQSIVDADCR